MFNKFILLISALLAQCASAFCYGSSYYDWYYKRQECYSYGGYNNRNQGSLTYFGMARAMGSTCEQEGQTVDATGWCWITDASKCPGGCAIDMRCGTEKEC